MRHISERPVVLVLVIVAVIIALMHWLPKPATVDPETHRAPLPPIQEEVAAGLDHTRSKAKPRVVEPPSNGRWEGASMIWLALLDELLDLAIELDSEIGLHGVIIGATLSLAFLYETARGLLWLAKGKNYP
jgi:hypothetical protein